jgi:hypothetical protein
VEAHRLNPERNSGSGWTVLAGGTRSWRAITTAVADVAVANGSELTVGSVTITDAAAGDYLLLGTINAYSTTVAIAADVRFYAGATQLCDLRNDLPVNVSLAQTHSWTYSHAGGTVTLSFRFIVASGTNRRQTCGEGLVVTRL